MTFAKQQGTDSMRIRIRELAFRNRGWSMKTLAERLEVDHQTVLYWNQGRAYPRLPMLLRMCRLLRCTVEELVQE